MTKLIDKTAAYNALKHEAETHELSFSAEAYDAYDRAARIIDQMPTIEAEPVRHGKGCKFCEGRSYTKKPLTVITRTMKHVEVVFEYCPACGRKMDGGDDNG